MNENHGCHWQLVCQCGPRDGALADKLPVAPKMTVEATFSEQRSCSIKRHKVSEKSLMPEGPLETLTDREQLELLKYLLNH